MDGHRRVDKFRVDLKYMETIRGRGCAEQVMDRGLEGVNLLHRRVVLQGSRDGGTKTYPGTIMHGRPDSLDVLIDVKKDKGDGGRREGSPKGERTGG